MGEGGRRWLDFESSARPLASCLHTACLSPDCRQPDASSFFSISLCFPFRLSCRHLSMIRFSIYLTLGAFLISLFPGLSFLLSKSRFAVPSFFSFFPFYLAFPSRFPVLLTTFSLENPANHFFGRLLLRFPSWQRSGVWLPFLFRVCSFVAVFAHPNLFASFLLHHIAHHVRRFLNFFHRSFQMNLHLFLAPAHLAFVAP